MSTPVHMIFRDIVGRVADACGMNVSYIFGDWGYICNQLAVWGQTASTARRKYPVVCLYLPYVEDRTGTEAKVSLEFLMLVNTLKGRSNDERERESFEAVLRPVYRTFMEEVAKEPRFVHNYDGTVPHLYTENFQYGRLGVLGADGKPFRDFVDAIEIKNMELTIRKERNCHVKRI